MEPIELLAEEIKRARRHTLDFLEKIYGNEPHWVRVRSHILRTFGENGLEKFLQLHGLEESLMRKQGEQSDSDNERVEALVSK